jgi:Ca-activated chloride channel family protein
MQVKTFLFSLSVAALTACAVEDSSQQQVVHEETENNPQSTHVIEQVNQHAKDSRHELDEVMVIAKEDKTSGDVRLPQRQEMQAHTSIQDISTTNVGASHALVKKMSAEQAGGRYYPVTPSPPGYIRQANEPLYRENYQHLDVNELFRVASDPVSTFSIDVDTGAYSNMRRFLNQGQLPPQDAVRVEEFINYFDYDYPFPKSTKAPFQASTEIAPTPWNTNTRLLRIGIQGYQVSRENIPPSNLVFLIDVSGSMNSPDKLPLLRQAMGMLVNQLDARDSISMVVYAGASGVVLPPTRGNRKADILNALNQLQAGGSTNGAAGIELAYQMAQQNFVKGGINRVILATDGDFNVGQASTEELIDMIQRKRDAGVALTTLGFGSGNINDHLLEQLADEGNGNYAYIDRLSEAQKVLCEELSATLLTIAKDVKIQVEFNPATVSEYRLIGYENRALNEQDFNNDQVDAGEIGAGHRVTALYEISLVGGNGDRLPGRRYPANKSAESADRPVTASFGHELAHLRIRYKLPNESTSRLIESPVMDSGINARGGDNFNFAAAVAAFAQKLRGGKYLNGYSYSEIAQLASSARGDDAQGYRSEFMQLVNLAGTLDHNANVAQTNGVQDKIQLIGVD